MSADIYKQDREQETPPSKVMLDFLQEIAFARMVTPQTIARALGYTTLSPPCKEWNYADLQGEINTLKSYQDDCADTYFFSHYIPSNFVSADIILEAEPAVLSSSFI
jgi:hypothetical protein